MNAIRITLFIDKRYILSFLILIGLVNNLYAQKFALGLKAGPLASWSVYGDKDDRKEFDSKASFGFYGAGVIEFPLNKNYYYILEAGYSTKGRNIRFNDGFGKNVARYHFTDAALLLRKGFKFNLGKNIPADVFFNIGPHVNYWLGGNGHIGPADNDGSAYTIVFNEEADLGQFDKMYLNDVNRWLFGLDIGVGMMAPITKTQRVLVELRFTSGHTFYGARNSASYSWIEFQDNLRANEKVLSLTAAYMFGFNIQESKKGTSTKDKEVNRKKVNKKKKR